MASLDPSSSERPSSEPEARRPALETAVASTGKDAPRDPVERRPPSREIYLIERQAILVRRRRWQERAGTLANAAQAASPSYERPSASSEPDAGATRPQRLRRWLRDLASKMDSTS